MKKQLSKFVLGLAFLSPVLGFSQAEKVQPCNTYAAMEDYFRQNPAARVSYEKSQAEAHEAYLQSLNNPNSNTQNRTAAAQFTVPVVFHILHLGGSENITDAQCEAALKQVNEDYAATGADFSTIFAPFQALYINSNIKFMLAKKDPTGNCTTGIEHIYSTKTDWEQSDFSYYNNLLWAPSKYLNIIIVKKIVPSGTVVGGGIIVGYTRKPAGTSTAIDAIVYNYGYLGGYNARSLSHEIGHWLNLDHTFGGTNNPGVTCGSSFGGDNVADTPDTKGNFGICPASSTNSTIVCTSGITPYYQNVENIMDYSTCPKNFTQGQTAVMQTALQAGTAGRNNLWQPANLAATDVNGVIPCTPVAEFLSANNSYTICSGGSLTMKDYSYNGAIATYSWTADNGAMAANPSNSVTAFTFPYVGNVDITLTIANAAGGTSTKVRSVTVIDGAQAGDLPGMESFEAPGVPNHWMVTNNNPNTSEWERTEDAAKDGQASFYINGSGSGAGNEDYLQMPVLNMAWSYDKTITFSCAYAKSVASQNDVLKVQGSKDCGGTWNDIAVYNATQLALNSGGTDANPFTPLPDQWKTYTISAQIPWASYLNLMSVLVRFNFVEGTTGGGNNIFIDAIKFSGIVGINELAKSIMLSVYPNPAVGEATVKFNLDDAAAVKMNVVDIYGKVVSEVTDANLSPGEHTISVNKDRKLASGIYFIDLSINGAKISNKLIVN